MGVDILFYRTKKHVFDQVVEDDNNDKHIDWDSLDKYEINYACGRHFTYDFIVENYGSTQICEFTDTDIKNILDRSNSVVNKWRVHNEELCTIPVTLLEKYLKEAKENDQELVTFPTSDISEDDDYIDDTDYYQAKNILETDWSKGEDEVIWFLNSY